MAISGEFFLTSHGNSVILQRLDGKNLAHDQGSGVLS